MRLNNADSAVREHCCWRLFLLEKEVTFFLPAWPRSTSVNGIFQIISSEMCSNCVRCLLLRLERVSRAYDLAPAFNCIFSYKFETCNDITCHELSEIVEEWLSSMLSIELPRWLKWQASHLHFADHETALLDGINNSASWCVGIWLDHCKSALSLVVELLSCEEISVLCQLKLSRVDGDDWADKKFVETDSGADHALQEDLL